MADYKNPNSPPPPRYADATAPPMACPSQYPPQQQYPPPQQYPPGPPQQYPPQQYPAQPCAPGYYQGPTPAQQQQQQQPGVVFISQPGVTYIGGTSPFQALPMQVTCPSCHNTVLTTVMFEVGLMCWLFVGVLFILGFWLCCCIPFCVDACKDAVHVCPACNLVVRRYKRL